MERSMNKLIYLALVLMLLAAVTCASADAANTATIEMSTSQWKANFLAKLGEFIKQDLSKATFDVTERPGFDTPFRFEHSCPVGDFASVLCFDDGKDAFNSGAITIKLDGVNESNSGLVWNIIFAAIMAGQPNVTVAQADELVNVICPAFDDVLAGKQRLNGVEGGTLYGVLYAMELNDKERYARFLINAKMTK